MRSGQFRNNRHFEQNFEDSQNNPGVYSYKNDNSPGRAIQLIRIRPNGKIQVDQDALDLISQCDLAVGFCCIAGKYRTGKSFLLNKLLRLQGSGFRVDPSTSACTEGIWMWSKPQINEKEGNYIFFIDTQGTASTNRDSTNDVKVFTLANLISSYLIYNSVGAIDQKSISQLNVVTQLSKNIILEQYVDLKSNEDNLYRYMPKFLWLIRDFVLEPTDKNGRKLKPAEYLQDALFQQNTAVKSDQSTKKIRRALTKFYKQRDCLTLVRPASEQRDLQKLNQLPEHSLRRDFINGINQLRDKVLKNTGPKMYQEHPLFGGAIASMIQSYVNMMNNGAIPSIHTAWEQINEDQGVYAYDIALTKFNELYAQNFQDDEPKGQQIHNLLRVISQASIDQFHQNLSQPNEVYQGRLKQYLSQKQQAILQVNKQLIEFRNIEILKQCMKPVTQKIQSNYYEGNADQYNTDIKEASQKYKQKAKGQNKGQILLQFITALNPIVLAMNSKEKGGQHQAQQAERLKRQYQMQIRNYKQQISSMKNQIDSIKGAKQPKSGVKQGKSGKKQLNVNGKGGKVDTQVRKGCCGGKCSIM